MKKSEALSQDTMPLWEAHRKYMESDVLRMDVPGHKAGRWATPMAEYLPQVFRYDINSCREIDNLSHPQSVIDDAHTLCATAFGADQAHFLVNGTTQGVHAMFLSTLRPGDAIMIPENAHKSTINGIILLGLRVHFVKPEFSREWGIANNVTLSSVQKTFERYPRSKALFVLNPTYYGIVADLKEIARWCRKMGIVLLCDEAHGSHFHFHRQLPLSAMEAGADASAMSIHKTSGSLTQSSILLWNERAIANTKVFRAVNVLQSTSPNYLLMSSLDAARWRLAKHGTEDITRTLELANYARHVIGQIEGVDIMDAQAVKNLKGAFSFDPTKLIMKFDRLGLTGFEVYEILRTRFGIQVELGEFKVIMAVITPADTQVTIDRLAVALAAVATKRHESPSNELQTIQANLYVERDMVYTVRRSFFLPVEEIAWNDAEGRVAGDTFMTYPPGISLLLPGQRITKKHIQYFRFLMRMGAQITSNASATDRIIVIDETKMGEDNDE